MARRRGLSGQALLKASLSGTIADAALTDAWLRLENGERPHDSIGLAPLMSLINGTIGYSLGRRASAHVDGGIGVYREKI